MRIRMTSMKKRPTKKYKKKICQKNICEHFFKLFDIHARYRDLGVCITH